MLTIANEQMPAIFSGLRHLQTRCMIEIEGLRGVSFGSD